MTIVEPGSFAAKRSRPDPERARLAADVVEGLSRPQKSLPSRYFYDARGSELFEEITRLPEYYPTRAETGILAAHAADIMRGSGGTTVLVELGSGSSRKTRLLLDVAPLLGAYVPVDVSFAALESARRRLRARYPMLEIRPVQGDFSARLTLPPELQHYSKVGFFPGSTIGNLEPEDARALLDRLRVTLLPESRLIVGVDLVKDIDTLLAAYDDAAGVTAAFNLNILARINRDLAPSFDLMTFTHAVHWNAARSRIEMHLASTEDQVVHVAGHSFHFARGETIHTESSHKYTVTGFRELAEKAGWRSNAVWTDTDRLFSVHELISG
ncbi:MAG: L-histidine N(alpha)-methyltransferase [Hyphomicrobiaceae bacterium]